MRAARPGINTRTDECTNALRSYDGVDAMDDGRHVGRYGSSVSIALSSHLYCACARAVRAAWIRLSTPSGVVVAMRDWMDAAATYSCAADGG